MTSATARKTPTCFCFIFLFVLYLKDRVLVLNTSTNNAVSEKTSKTHNEENKSLE
jgi:hypothetical protein